MKTWYKKYIDYNCSSSELFYIEVDKNNIWVNIVNKIKSVIESSYSKHVSLLSRVLLFIMVDQEDFTFASIIGKCIVLAQRLLSVVKKMIAVSHFEKYYLQMKEVNCL